MLISFAIENWMSFRQRAEFSMVATKERQHGGRVIKLPRYRTRVVPVAAIFGGNASGKTNFFHALGFAKYFVTQGIGKGNRIPVSSFRLAQDSRSAPTRFCFELLAGDEQIYEYSFSANEHAVLSERLTLIKAKTEHLLFERTGQEIEWGALAEDNDLLKFSFRGTASNRLLLTNSVHQSVDTFRPVFDWFEDTLELVAPDDRFAPFEEFATEGGALYDTMSEMLQRLGTSVKRLGRVQVPIDTLDLPEDLRRRLDLELGEGESRRLMFNDAHKYVVTRVGGKLDLEKLVSFHLDDQGSEVRFDMRDESDGTRRLIDMIPGLVDVTTAGHRRVYIFDELDRSLHTLLTRQLLEFYLSHCHEGWRSQLLFTTHDAMLMDQDLFRRDELWLVERDHQDASRLTGIAEFSDVRYDKDIRKSYLQGRMGGVPMLLLGSTGPAPSSDRRYEPEV